MAGKFVLVICPDMIGQTEVDAFGVAMNDATRVEDYPFTFRAHTHRRVLEATAIKRKFPDRVVFTIPTHLSLCELVELARQYNYLLPIKNVEKSHSTIGEGNAEVKEAKK
ncbi:MAG: hypothetical protein Q8R25_01790 [bacterium]|nr:hypothetical protein [bacterium]